MEPPMEPPDGLFVQLVNYYLPEAFSRKLFLSKLIFEIIPILQLVPICSL